MERQPANRYRSMLELEADLAELDPHGPLPRASSTLLTPLSSIAVTESAPPSDAVAQSSRRMPLTVCATQTARAVRSARPLVVLMSALSYLWVTSGLVVIGVDMIRWVGGPGQR